jgi:GntR family transcriptional regulator
MERHDSDLRAPAGGVLVTVPPTLVVTAEDPTPPYEQLRRQLAELILSGVLAPGDRLPPLRQLAGDLGLAVGTVGRAYRELETAGLVRSRRGGGTRVTGDARPSTAEQLRHHATAYVRQAVLLGVDEQTAISAVHDAFRTHP